MTEPQIGTLNEHSLHAALKEHLLTAEGRTEVPCCGYVADILDGDAVTEIQTGIPPRLLQKLTTMLDVGYRVTVVLPVITAKRVIVLDPESGEVLSDRRSPKRETYLSAAAKLYPIRSLLTGRGLTVRLQTAELTEYRQGRKTKKYQQVPKDQVPALFGEALFLRTAEDYEALLPDMEDGFSAAAFQKCARLGERAAWQVLQVWMVLGLLRREKQGRGYLYFRCFDRPDHG